MLGWPQTRRGPDWSRPPPCHTAPKPMGWCGNLWASACEGRARIFARPGRGPPGRLFFLRAGTAGARRTRRVSGVRWEPRRGAGSWPALPPFRELSAHASKGVHPPFPFSHPLIQWQCVVMSGHGRGLAGSARHSSRGTSREPAGALFSRKMHFRNGFFENLHKTFKN